MTAPNPWRASLFVGLVFGALWGAVEALVHQAVVLLSVWSETGLWLPIDPISGLAILFQAAWRYAVVCVIVTPSE